MLGLLATSAQESPYEIRLSAWVVMIITGAAIPLVTAILTKYNAHPLLKGMITIALTAVAALLTQSQLNDGVAVISKQSLFLWFAGLAAAESAYYSAWKPAGAARVLFPRAGLGPESPPPPR